MPGPQQRCHTAQYGSYVCEYAWRNLSGFQSVLCHAHMCVNKRDPNFVGTSKKTGFKKHFVWIKLCWVCVHGMHGEPPKNAHAQIGSPANISKFPYSFARHCLKVCPHMYTNTNEM